MSKELTPADLDTVDRLVAIAKECRGNENVVFPGLVDHHRQIRDNALCKAAQIMGIHPGQPGTGDKDELG